MLKKILFLVSITPLVLDIKNIHSAEALVKQGKGGLCYEFKTQESCDLFNKYMSDHKDEFSRFIYVYNDIPNIETYCAIYSVDGANKDSLVHDNEFKAQSNIIDKFLSEVKNFSRCCRVTIYAD